MTTTQDVLIPCHVGISPKFKNISKIIRKKIQNANNKQTKKTIKTINTINKVITTNKRTYK